jgi:hypothetical protein
MHQTVNLAGYALRRFESFPVQFFLLLARKIQLTDGLRRPGLEISVRPAMDGGPVPTGESRLDVVLSDPFPVKP